MTALKIFTHFDFDIVLKITGKLLELYVERPHAFTHIHLLFTFCLSGFIILSI